MFKLLKFVESYKEFVYLTNDFKMDEFRKTMKSIFIEFDFSGASSDVLDNSLKLVIKFSGFFYYILDNMIWVLNVGVISDQIVRRGVMKKTKDIFSLIKNYFQVFRSIIMFR